MKQCVMNNVMKTKASVVMQPMTNIEETSWQDKFEKGRKSLLVLKTKLLSIESASQVRLRQKTKFGLLSFIFTHY